MQQRKASQRDAAAALQVTIPVDAEQPESSSFATASRKRRIAHSYQTRATAGWILTFSVLTLCCVAGHRYLLRWEAEQQELISHRIREEMDPVTKEWEEKVVQLKEENSMLRETRTEPPQVDPKKMQQRIAHLLEYKERLHKAIQDMSRQQVLEKFGPGPHLVEIQLDFDPASSIPGTADRFVIQMAPVDEMPHAVHLFLEQVSRGLYDGCSFHRNAHHVVQGGPAPNFATLDDAHLYQRFHDFASVSFQEYSPKFPHEKYTLGYAGRPGGPDFYVSMQNNTVTHGPGGQSAYEDPGEADPCFARVVEGLDAVDRMHESPVKDGDYNHMVHNIAIRHMNIIPNR